MWHSFVSHTHIENRQKPVHSNCLRLPVHTVVSPWHSRLDQIENSWEECMHLAVVFSCQFSPQPQTHALNHAYDRQIMFKTVTHPVLTVWCSLRLLSRDFTVFLKDMFVQVVLGYTGTTSLQISPFNVRPYLSLPLKWSQHTEKCKGTHKWTAKTF